MRTSAIAGLREGDQLPTVKAVVARLAINPNSVLKAYRGLEHGGLVAASGAAQLPMVGFVAQETPLDAGLSVEDHLRLGARLNPEWDDAMARRRTDRLGMDLSQRAGKLSGGHRAQLGLTLGIAKRPELLILDEPVASLDPLARREVLRDLMEVVAEHGLSVVVASRVRLDRDIDTLLATTVRGAPATKSAAGVD